jgi:nicotinate-nucleotide adenylyltransferase
VSSDAVGILGGTFDPVHNAHLAMARAALAHLSPETILFIPTGNPPYRKPPVASAEHRLAMLRLAVQENPKFRIDERELSPGATGYTVDTLKALRADSPGTRLLLLMGSDQYSKLAFWHQPDEVARLAEIVVFARPGWKIAGNNVKTVPMPPLDESASEIRARAARGEGLTALVPAAVENYIVRNGLYRGLHT